MLIGSTLATSPEDIYRALMEATAFGTRTIIEDFEKSGVAVSELVIAGGMLRNPFLLQIYADVTRRPLSTIGSEQGPALGSAIHAAVAAGAYPDVYSASKSMGKINKNVYVPDEERARSYDALYAIYTELHDHFGRGGSNALHTLGASATPRPPERRPSRRRARRTSVPMPSPPVTTKPCSVQEAMYEAGKRSLRDEAELRPGSSATCAGYRENAIGSVQGFRATPPT